MLDHDGLLGRKSGSTFWEKMDGFAGWPIVLAEVGKMPDGEITGLVGDAFVRACPVVKDLKGNNAQARQLV
ncbi:hypothetical protein CU048_11510 [Beijerinckiaceae bacterium]|nr:hypothetical protein CU048_11510 [Beijerinckiaceae bacterium]